MTAFCRALTGAGFTLGFVLIAEPALAHPPPLGIPGFLGGLLHPMFVTAHLLAIVGLALLTGQQMPGWDRMVPFFFIASLAAGLAVMTLGYVPVLMTQIVLLCALATGLLVAWGQPMPESAGCVLSVVTAFCIALDSPPEVVSVREANFMLIGTGFGATLLMVAAVEISSRIKRLSMRIGARVIGSWIAASAILVLALSFVR